MKKKASRPTRRLAELRSSLEARRSRLVADLTELKRGMRSRTPDERDASDAFEGIEANIQDDLDFAVIQLKGETLARIEAALRRLDAGAYGDCQECGLAISKERLQAMPFAVRCTSCEEARERRVAGGGPKPGSPRLPPHRLLDATE
jgi:DnaK suppressor protein